MDQTKILQYTFIILIILTIFGSFITEFLKEEESAKRI